MDETLVRLGRTCGCTDNAYIWIWARLSFLGIGRQANLPDASVTAVGQVPVEYDVKDMGLEPQVSEYYFKRMKMARLVKAAWMRISSRNRFVRT